jgi:hypothetical protein
VLHDPQRLLGHVVPGFREQVVARVDQADRGRRTRPGRLLRIELRLRVLDAIDVELDFQPALHRDAVVRQPLESALQYAPGVELDRPSVLEPGLPAHPARCGGPRQLPEACRIGQQYEVAGAFEAGEVGDAARLEHPENGSVRSVLEQQGAHHAHAFAHRAFGRGRDQCLAARDAVHVAPDEAHQFQACRVDQLRRVARGVVARSVVDAATLRKTRHAGTTGAAASPIQGADSRLART